MVKIRSDLNVTFSEYGQNKFVTVKIRFFTNHFKKSLKIFFKVEYLWNYLFWD